MGTTLATEKRARYDMPVAPFREILERTIKERSASGLTETSQYMNDGLMTPLDAMTEQLALKAGKSYEAISRRLYDILNGKVSKINFDLADAIVCTFDFPGFWYSDERVKNLYMQIGEEG